MNFIYRNGCLALLLLLVPLIGDGSHAGKLYGYDSESSLSTARKNNREGSLPVETNLSRISASDVPELACQLPGEFEPQRALLLACHELIYIAPDLFVEIVNAASGRISIVAMVTSNNERELAKKLLRSRSVSYQHVRFIELPHDTMWARDYGPIIVKSQRGEAVIIDAGYDFSRNNDDQVPEKLAHSLNLQVVRMPLLLAGGNMLCNGDGLAITTYTLIDDNVENEVDEQTARELMQRVYGLKEVVMLEPLGGEATGHVDMFATFTSMNTVVVGKCDPKIDPENAAILDRNADRLSALQTTKGPLRVVRIPMPPHDDGVWRTYSNVIYANGALLVPTYADVDPAGMQQAIATYTKLLPQWKVIGIDASRVIESAGALHCISMNLGPLGINPKFSQPPAGATDFFSLPIPKSNLLARNSFRFASVENSNYWVSRGEAPDVTESSPRQSRKRKLVQKRSQRRRVYFQISRIEDKQAKPLLFSILLAACFSSLSTPNHSMVSNRSFATNAIRE